MDYVLVLAAIIQLLIALGVFTVLVRIGKFTFNKFRSSSFFKNSRFLKLHEYFPSEEVFALKQVFYLILILIFIVIILYLLFDWGNYYFVFALDIIISLYIAINMGKDSFKEKSVLFLLIPFSSITGLLFGNIEIINLLDIFHVMGYLYFINVYYHKFVQYTESNSLGITIMLLFSIILVTFLVTIIAENVSPLDSITMVSNAFTSNSFEASGNTTVGKLNSLVLAWGGFILSGVGTATLAVSIVLGYVNQRFDEIEDLVRQKKKKD